MEADLFIAGIVIKSIDHQEDTENISAYLLPIYCFY